MHVENISLLLLEIHVGLIKQNNEKVRSGNASEEEKEELYDQIHENTCGYCEVSMML